jgi:hypothetical protein
MCASLLLAALEDISVVQGGFEHVCLLFFLATLLDYRNYRNMRIFIKNIAPHDIVGNLVSCNFFFFCVHSLNVMRINVVGHQ